MAQVVGLSEQRVRTILRARREPISIDSPVGDEEDSHLVDFIEDKATESPLQKAEADNLKEVVHEVLASLSPREAKVLMLRYGIDTNTEHTLEELGRQMENQRSLLVQTRRQEEAISQQFQELKGYAQVYRDTDFDEKRRIVSALVEKVMASRGYKIQIMFRVGVDLLEGFAENMGNVTEEAS